jgi:hypothetical protein
LPILLSKKVLDALKKKKVQCPQHPQIVSTSPPSQLKAPDQPLHCVENPIAQNIPYHCVVKATPALAFKSEQNGLYHQHGSPREFLFEMTHKMHHDALQLFAQIMTLMDKTTVKMDIQLRLKLKRLSDKDVNQPLGRPPRKQMKKKNDFPILPLGRGQF